MILRQTNAAERISPTKSAGKMSMPMMHQSFGGISLQEQRGRYAWVSSSGNLPSTGHPVERSEQQNERVDRIVMGMGLQIAYRFIDKIINDQS